MKRAVEEQKFFFVEKVDPTAAAGKRKYFFVFNVFQGQSNSMPAINRSLSDVLKVHEHEIKWVVTGRIDLLCAHALWHDMPCQNAFLRRQHKTNRPKEDSNLKDHHS